VQWPRIGERYRLIESVRRKDVGRRERGSKDRGNTKDVIEIWV
jgi:hypothetical protein